MALTCMARTFDNWKESMVNQVKKLKMGNVAVRQELKQANKRIAGLFEENKVSKIDFKYTKSIIEELAIKT